MATSTYTRKRTNSFSVHSAPKVARLHLTADHPSSLDAIAMSAASKSANMLGLSFEPPKPSYGHGLLFRAPTSPRGSSSLSLPPLVIPSHHRIPKPAKHLRHPLVVTDEIIIIAPCDPLPPPPPIVPLARVPSRQPPSPSKPQVPRTTSPLAPHPVRVLPPRPTFPRSKKSQNLYKQALQAQLATTPAGRKIRAVGARTAISMIEADEEFHRLMKKGRERRWRDAQAACKTLLPEVDEDEESSSDSDDSDGESEDLKTPEAEVADDALWMDVLGLNQDDEDWSLVTSNQTPKSLIDPDPYPSALGLSLTGI